MSDCYHKVKNFGETAAVKHWREKLWRIDAQKLLYGELMLKNYYKALNYILVKLRIVKIVIGRFPCVKMTMFGFAMIRGYHE